MFNQFERTGIVNSYDRLSKILKNDKIHLPQMIENCLKQDIVRVVSSYFNIKECNTDLRIELEGNGEVLLTFEGVADGFKAKLK